MNSLPSTVKIGKPTLLVVCGKCQGRGRVLQETAFEGGKRYRFVSCECSPEPEVQKSSRQSPRFSMRSLNRRCEIDYREDLSRFPGDPEAYVSGPRDLKRLKDKRKREGWEMRSIEEVANTPRPEMRSGEEIARESYEAARANNFESEVVSD